MGDKLLLAYLCCAGTLTDVISDWFIKHEVNSRVTEVTLWCSTSEALRDGLASSECKDETQKIIASHFLLLKKVLSYTFIHLFVSDPSRQCHSGAWGPVSLSGEGHQELLPDQSRILLHAAGWKGRQRKVLVPIAHVVHGHHLRPGGLYATAQAGDGHPAVTRHALPRGWVRWLWLPSTWIWTWLSGRLSPGLQILMCAV